MSTQQVLAFSCLLQIISYALEQWVRVVIEGIE